MPGLFDEIATAAVGALGEKEKARLDRATDRAKQAVAEYADWLHESLAHAVDDWPLGREHLRRAHPAARLRRPGRRRHPRDRRGAAGREQGSSRPRQPGRSTRRADEPTVVDRIKNDHPATFAEALEAYRDVMLRARQHLIDRDIVTVPADERIEVIETPEYLRNVIPFAAYFEPPKFDRSRSGIYVVTPSVGNDPNAMREHNWALDQQHLDPRGVSRPPPPAVGRDAASLADASAGGCARVRRGLGDVQRADDARAGLRRRARSSG